MANRLESVSLLLLGVGIGMGAGKKGVFNAVVFKLGLLFLSFFESRPMLILTTEFYLVIHGSRTSG